MVMIVIEVEKKARQMIHPDDLDLLDRSNGVMAS